MKKITLQIFPAFLVAIIFLCCENYPDEFNYYNYYYGDTTIVNDTIIVTDTLIDTVYIDTTSFLCDPNELLFLNGITYPDGSRISRNSRGCIIGIDFSFFRLQDPHCLYDIENYADYLEELNLMGNLFDGGIDLSPVSYCEKLKLFRIDASVISYLNISPLSSCKSLKWLWLDNNLDSIDLTPLWALDSLIYLSIYRVNNETLICPQVIAFQEDHPWCDVRSRCVGDTFRTYSKE